MADPQTLLTNAKCYLCLGITLAEALQLALLDQISSGGGGGGGVGSVLSGHGSPIGVVIPTTDTAIYFDEDTGIQYNYFAGAWH
jgi:hypothetical protein